MEVATDPATLDDTSNAMKIGAALGLSRERTAHALGYVGRATEQHDVLQRSMNVALWQASWGYYLGNMVGFESTGFTPEGLAWARDHFVSHVRAAGAFPTVRTGRQPYGVLPGDLARLVEAGRGRRGHAFARRVLEGPPGRSARQVLAIQARPGRAGGAAAGAARSRRGSRRRDAKRGVLRRLSCAQPLRPSLPAASARVHRRGSAGDGIHRRRGRDLRRCSAAPGCAMAPPHRRGDLRRIELRPQVRPRARRRGVAVEAARARLHRGVARGASHRCLDRGAAGRRRYGREHEPAADALAPRAAARDCRGGGPGRRAGASRQCLAALARCGAQRSGRRKWAFADLQASAGDEGRGDHRRSHDPGGHRGCASRDCRSGGCCRARRPRRSSREPQGPAGARQRDVAIADAGHARPRVASPRCLDHVLRGQAACGAASPKRHRAARGRLRVGREPASDAGLGHGARDAATRRIGAARSSGR